MLATERVAPMGTPPQPVEKLVSAATPEPGREQRVRSIGDILVADGKLTARGAQQVWNLQRRSGMRFGEAALQLDLVTQDDLRRALAKQYDFCYLEPGQRGVSREIVAAYEPYHQRVEEFRVLRTQLLIRWFGAEGGRRTLAIVSPGPGEGRTYLAANLAVVFSQLGHRTLLIDADMRLSRQHRLFHLSDRIGLSAVLSGRSDLRAATRIPGMNGLWVLPAGPFPPNPQELLSRNAFAALLQHAEASFDVVLIDTPPARLCADPQAVASRAGGALVVVRKDHTRVAEASDVVREVGNFGVRIVGTVMNAF